MSPFNIDQFWHFALLAIPLTAIVAAVCRCLPCRPATRHILWLTLLVLLVVAPLFPRSPAPDLTSLLPIVESVDTPKNESPQVITQESGKGSAVGSSSSDPLKAKTPISPDLAASSLPLNTPVKIDRSHATKSGNTLAERRVDLKIPVDQKGKQPLKAPEKEQISTTPLLGQRLSLHTNRLKVPDPIRQLRSHKSHTDDVPDDQPADQPGTSLAHGLTNIQPATPDTASFPSATLPNVYGISESYDHSETSVTANNQSEVLHKAPPHKKAFFVLPQEGKLSPVEKSDWTRWAVSLRSIRDEILQLPPLPIVIWGGGAVFFLLVIILRIVRFQRYVRSAVPAPHEVETDVCRIATEMGLRSIPSVLMVDARISPMVSFGYSLRLLLPTDLWNQLDEVGRRAVLSHELAHLKRRDHWVCWLAMIVGCLYWWHPIVWLIQRRLREEADLCCDVWVTTLMPSARRAYATALLETKKFTDLNRSPIPMVALCITTIHAKGFARRLTMVMSQQIKPRLTLGGILLAGVLVTGTWLVTPTFACDTDDHVKAKPAKPVKTTPSRAAELAEVLATISVIEAENSAAACAKAACAEAAACNAAQASCGVSSCNEPQAPTAWVSGSSQGTGCSGSLEDRLLAVEHKLEQLARLSGLQMCAPDAPQIPQVPTVFLDRGQFNSTAFTAPTLPELLVSSPTMGTDFVVTAPTMNFNSQDYQIVGVGSVIQKTYELPEGKLEALTELMIRSDVPILVSPGDDAITVHGTTSQHMIFTAFVDMINGEDEVEIYELSPGKLDALSELMIRSDVPIYVTPGDGEIKVRGTTLEQTVFKAFVDMINDDAPSTPLGYTDMLLAPDTPDVISLDDMPKKYEYKAASKMYELEALKTKLEAIYVQMEEREHGSSQLAQRVEELELKAEHAEEMADELEAEFEEAEGDERINLIKQYNDLLMKVHQLENEARITQARAEVQYNLAERLESEAEELEDRIDDLEDMIQEAVGRSD